MRTGACTVSPAVCPSSVMLRHREPSITKTPLTLSNHKGAAPTKTLPKGSVMSPEPNTSVLGLRSKGGRR